MQSTSVRGIAAFITALVKADPASRNAFVKITLYCHHISTY